MTETDDKTLENIREHLVGLTKDLMLIPGTVQRPEDIYRCISFVKDYLKDLDSVEIREYSHDDNPSIVALPDGIDEPEILLVSHLDVIGHSDVGVYNPRVSNGRIYGPGSGDMKGAMSIMMELFRHFQTSRPGISLGIAITSDEEQGGVSGIGHLFNDVGLRCGLAINPDGGSLNEITIAEKGVVQLKVICTGQSGHAARPWLGQNALECLILKLNALKNYFTEMKKKDTNWYPTCALTVLSTPNKTINRIPDIAEALLDIRFPPPYTVDKIVSESSRILGYDVETHVTLSAEPVEFESNTLFAEIIEEVTSSPASLISEDGASDCRFIHRYGIPVIISRPFVGDLHTADEWIDIDSMVKFYRICKLFIERRLLNL